MAKNFLNYGTAKGLGKSIDYTSIVNQRLQNEQLLNQTKQRAEERAAFVAEKMTPHTSEVEWITEEYNPFADKLNKKVTSFFKSNPNWRYTTEGQMEFNKLSQQYLNNPIVNIEETSKKNYDAFQKAIPNMTRKQIVREQEKYRQYFEDDQPQRGPYVFDASQPYNLTDIFTNGAEGLGVDFGSKGYEDWKRIDTGKLNVAASTLYSDNKEDLDDAWNGLDERIREGRFNGNQMDWIRQNIKSKKSEGSVYDRTAANYNARTNASLKGNSGTDYYNENIYRHVLTDKPKRVNKNWLLTTNSDITDPEKGAILNDPSEVFIKNDDGSVQSLANYFNFSSIKLTNAHEAFALPEDMGATQGYNEYMDVSAEIEWDGDVDESDFKNLEFLDYLERINLRPVDEPLSFMEEYLLSIRSGEKKDKNEAVTALSELFKNNKMYKASLTVPIQRESSEAKTIYNKKLGGQANALKADQLPLPPRTGDVEGWNSLVQEG